MFQRVGTVMRNVWAVEVCTTRLAAMPGLLVLFCLRSWFETLGIVMPAIL